MTEASGFFAFVGGMACGPRPARYGACHVDRLMSKPLGAGPWSGWWSWGHRVEVPSLRDWWAGGRSHGGRNK